MNKHFLKRRIMMLNQSKTSQKAMYKLLLALPIIIACLFIQACSEKILEPSSKSNGFVNAKTYNLDKVPQGQTSAKYSLMLAEGTAYKLYNSKENPINLNNTAWTLQRIDQDSKQVIEDVISWKKGDKVLAETLYESPKTGLYHLTFHAINNQPLQGEMKLDFYQGDALKKKDEAVDDDYLANFKTIKEMDLVGDATFTINVKQGNLLMKINGSQDNAKPADGWLIELYDAEGNKKAANAFQDRYFDNFAYKAREKKQKMKVVIKKMEGAVLGNRITFGLHKANE